MKKKIPRKGLIVMGDLPKWKNKMIIQKRSHYNGGPIQVEKYKEMVSL
jgi:hypothetical protein